MFGCLQQSGTAYAYPTFMARAAPAPGQCSLRQCAEQFAGRSLGYLDNSGVSGNIIAVGNAGKPCDVTRTCDNFGHCHTQSVCSVLSLANCAGSTTL